MPPLTAPANILVTGGSGFIGSWVIRRLLERGYCVRAAVRTAAKGDFLCKIFSDYSSKFQHVIIPDLEVDGAFDEALTGIHGVQHIASPVGGNPDEVIDAAINGTMSMLRSVAVNGKDLRRVIITSSAAAVREPQEYPYVYTENDWNLSATKALENENATPVQKYYASKTLAEQAAWKFAGERNIDLITLLPTFVIGPVIHEVQSLEKLNFSSAFFYDGILHEKGVGTTFGNWVDVRDVADAHILAMENEKASGQRFILCAGPASWQLIYDTLHDTAPELQNIPKGQRGNKEGKPQWTFATEKIENLGMKFLPLAQSASDTVASMREHGW